MYVQERFMYVQECLSRLKRSSLWQRNRKMGIDIAENEEWKID